MADDRVYQDSLQRARNEILARLAEMREDHDVSTDAEAEAYADRAVDDEIAAVATLSNSELSATLHLIDAALKRLENGTYGRCAVDERRIQKKRLLAMPWVRLCLKHQTQKDEDDGARTFTM